MQKFEEIKTIQVNDLIGKVNQNISFVKENQIEGDKTGLLDFWDLIKNALESFTASGLMDWLKSAGSHITLFKQLLSSFKTAVTKAVDSAKSLEYWSKQPADDPERENNLKNYGELLGKAIADIESVSKQLEDMINNLS